jgi:hypothetical protein
MLWSDRQGQAVNAEAAALLMEPDAGECADIAGTVPTPDNPATPSMPPGALPCELHILVRYTLPEYISFMWQHAGFLIRRRRIRWPASLYMRARSTAGAALHFILLRRGRRSYEFTIDEHGIVRTSDTGVSLIGWEDVTAIRTYSPGFMMVLKRGTLPIPFRCLRSDDVDAMKCLAAARKANAAAHAAAAA